MVPYALVTKRSRIPVQRILCCKEWGLNFVPIYLEMAPNMVMCKEVITHLLMGILILWVLHRMIQLRIISVYRRNVMLGYYKNVDTNWLQKLVGKNCNLEKRSEERWDLKLVEKIWNFRIWSEKGWDQKSVEKIWNLRLRNDKRWDQKLFRRNISL